MATLTEVMARRERSGDKVTASCSLWPRAHFPVAKMAMPAGKISRSAVSRNRVHRGARFGTRPSPRSDI